MFSQFTNENVYWKIGRFLLCDTMELKRFNRPANSSHTHNHNGFCFYVNQKQKIEKETEMKISIQLMKKKKKFIYIKSLLCSALINVAIFAFYLLFVVFVVVFLFVGIEYAIYIQK